MSESRPDGSTHWLKVNKARAVIDEVKRKYIGGAWRSWGTHNEYSTADGRLLWKAHPSACTVSGTTVTVQSNVGLVELYKYSDDPDQGGAAYSSVSSQYVCRGHPEGEGEKILVRTYTYEAAHWPRPSTITTYVEAPGEEPRGSTVSYAYEYYDPDAKNLKLVTKTLPAIPTQENGHGTWQGRERTCYHPAYGKVLWTEVKVWEDPPEYRVRAYAYL